MLDFITTVYFVEFSFVTPCSQFFIDVTAGILKSSVEPKNFKVKLSFYFNLGIYLNSSF